MIRTALVGLGKMGLSHLAMLRGHSDIDVVAVCDTFGMLLNGLNKHTGLKIYGDFEEMLDKEQLDAVFIATPSRFHSLMVKQSLDRNLHVFCEKPFCLDIEEGRELAALAERKGVVNQVGYHYRFLGTFIEAKRLLASDLIGEVHHIRAEAYGPVVLRRKGMTWRSNKAEGGGCLYDYACHAIDLITFLHVSPLDAEGTILNKVFSTDVDDEVYTTFRFRGGATGQLAANWSDESLRKMSMQITVWGLNGRMRIDRQEIQIYLKQEQASSSKFRRGWNTRYTTELTEPVSFYLRGEEYSMQIDHFVSCIKDRNNRQVSSFESALQTDTVLCKMIQDANKIRTVDDSRAAFSPSQHANFHLRDLATSFKSMFRRTQSQSSE
jgi:scyllo-inositol 2-dehydrogenase (NADP+)